MDDQGAEREILRYQLEFRDGGRNSSGRRVSEQDESPVPARDSHRRRTGFDPTREPATYREPTSQATPEETAALQEKANAGRAARAMNLANPRGRLVDNFPSNRPSLLAAHGHRTSEAEVRALMGMDGPSRA